MTLFKDGDGSAYVIFASECDSVTRIARLSDDYLSAVGECTRAFDSGRKHGGREAPALFKHDGCYFMVSSCCTGWDPNPAEYAVARSVRGPWEVKGNPCVGEDSHATFHAQSTFVLPVAGRAGAFIFMADRWNKDDLRDSRYVWLPLRIVGTQVTVEWLDCWDLTVFERGQAGGTPGR
jgi:beta-xylosidase